LIWIPTSNNAFDEKSVRLAIKKFAQLRSKKGGAVGARIKVKKQPAISFRKTRPNVVDENSQSAGDHSTAIANAGRSGENRCGAQSRDRISPEIGQGRLSLDPTDKRATSRSASVARRALVVGIEAENLVAEEFADVEKITAPQPRSTIRIGGGANRSKDLGAPDIDLDPVNNIFEAVDPRPSWPIGILLPQLLEHARDPVFPKYAVC